MTWINDKLNKEFGIPKTGYDVSYRYLHMSRQMGKTTTLIQSLPDNEPCFVIVHNTEIKRDMSDKITKTRPNVKVNIIVAKTLRELYEKMNEFAELEFIPKKKNIFVDNCVWDCIYMDMIRNFHNDPTKNPLHISEDDE